jgi:hypothetical protein
MSYNTTVLDPRQLENHDWKYTKATPQIDVCDIVKLDFRPRCSIKKLSKTLYMTGKYVDGEFITDGEVKEVMPNGERNTRSLRKIFVDLRQLICNNFAADRADRQRFITLTYAENMTDEKQLHNDFKLFVRKLARRLPPFGYIVIVEPQGRGAWHAHMLVRFDEPVDYIDYDIVRELWGHGRVQVDKLDNTDNLGAYFIAYFTNWEIPDDQLDEYKDDIVEKNGKKYIKGERLKFYPDYMKIYRASKDMIKPEGHESRTKYYEEIFPVLAYERAVAFTADEDNNRELTVLKQQRRKK